MIRPVRLQQQQQQQLLVLQLQRSRSTESSSSAISPASSSDSMDDYCAKEKPGKQPLRPESQYTYTYMYYHLLRGVLLLGALGAASLPATFYRANQQPAQTNAFLSPQVAAQLQRPASTSTTAWTNATSIVEAQQLHPEPVQCVAFRATANCSPDGRRRPWRDTSCTRLILPWESGYCEYQTHDGRSFRVMQTACRPALTNLIKTQSLFSCNMAVDFLNYQHQARMFQPQPPVALSSLATTSSSSSPSSLSSSISDRMEYATKASANNNTRGIVMAVYENAVVGAYSLVKLLREYHQCSLPVELWSSPTEVDPDNPFMLKLLQLPNVTRRFIHDKTVRGYMTKPYSIFYSAFDQVLFLDADNFPVQDPTMLFHSPQFHDTGAIFWKDYWQPSNTMDNAPITQQSMLWELLGISYKDEFEMESGQMIIDKTKSIQALNALMFLTFTFESRWLAPLSLAWGDKDLFRFAWRMTNTDFHMTATPPSPIGFAQYQTELPLFRDLFHNNMMGWSTCGLSMVQYDPVSGNPLFLHRNQIKISKANRPSWTQLMWHKYYRFSRTRFSGRLPPFHQQFWHKLYRFSGTDYTSQYRITHTRYHLADLTCYHPAAEAAEWFEEIDLQGSPLQEIEAKLLEYSREGSEVEEEANYS